MLSSQKRNVNGAPKGLPDPPLMSSDMRPPDCCLLLLGSIVSQHKTKK